LLCEKEHRQALGAKSERNALVRSAGERRRSSRAAMWAGGDGWMAAGRFSHFGQEPMNRRAGGACRGSLGEVHRFFRTDTNERIWAEGVTAPRVILLFLERSFEPPARLMLAQPERGGRKFTLITLFTAASGPHARYKRAASCSVHGSARSSCTDTRPKQHKTPPDPLAACLR
jgi:hypothetical protein